MRQTVVILLVILSGSLETRALLRQLSQDKVRNKRTDLPLHPPGLVMPLCHDHLLLSFFIHCLHLSMCPLFTPPVYLCFKSDAKQRSPHHHFSLIPAVWSLFEQKRQSLEFSPACPCIFILLFNCLCSCQPLLFGRAAYLILVRYSSLHLPLLSPHVFSLL